MRLLIATCIVFTVRAAFVLASLAFLVAICVSVGLDVRDALLAVALTVGGVAIALLYGWADDVRREALR